MITAHQNQIIIDDLYVVFHGSREMMITAHQNHIIIDDLYVSFQRDDDHRTSESDR